MHCTFGDANPVGDVPQSGGGILCQANKYMPVVAEKRPGIGLRFNAHVLYEMLSFECV